jgi:hypothetical protein
MRRLHLPRRRHLSVAAVVVGILSAVAVVFVPVEVAFGDDPILRLRRLDTTADPHSTSVAGPPAVEGLRGGSDAASLYGIARDRACRDESAKRVLTAVAASAVVVLAGFHALGPRRRLTGDAR